MCTNPLRYHVADLHCEACEKRITERLEAVAEVTGVAVDLVTKEVVVLGEGVDDAAARKAIMLAGYTPREWTAAVAG
jgi:copper chaperone CopZ